MKRFLTVTGLAALASSLMLGASGCTTATNTNSLIATNGNANAPSSATNANASAATSGGNAAMAAEVTARERQMWDTLKNKDHEAFGKMLSSDSIYISTDGVCDKPCSVNGVKNFAPTEINLSDVKTVVLDEDAAVVTYTLDAKGTSQGQPLPAGALRVSTAWVKRGGEWVAVYHQDSPVREAAATSTPAAATATPAAETSKPAGGAANANTPPSEAKHPEMLASDDPVAIEKHLWEALRQKDWDTFAAHLAPEQVEVEPGGVSDRAGTLASIRGVDFSKTTTSDFKAVKLDDDATVVTYMVRGTSPDGKPSQHRASTIWVKRDGKWLAYFHHGTPVIATPAR
ncbi:MAG TPA: nuclear transport factor 2 family protein [Pyrinomonadaceae bacterium]|jgi:hypothetical protein